MYVHSRDRGFENEWGIQPDCPTTIWVRLLMLDLLLVDPADDTPLLSSPEMLKVISYLSLYFQSLEIKGQDVDSQEQRLAIAASLQNGYYTPPPARTVNAIEIRYQCR